MLKKGEFLPFNAKFFGGHSDFGDHDADVADEVAFDSVFRGDWAREFDGLAKVMDESPSDDPISIEFRIEFADLLRHIGHADAVVKETAREIVVIPDRGWVDDVSCPQENPYRH